MKILFTNFHKRNGGGHVSYILHLLSQFGDHDCWVATPDTSRLFRYASALEGVTVRDQAFNSRIGRMVPEVRQLRKLIQNEQFDIVHVNASADHRHVMLACLGLPRQQRPRIVFTKHNDHSVHTIGHRLRAWLGTDAVIAVSRYVAQLFVGSAYEAFPVHVIHHGIDIHYFAPPSATRRSEARQALLGADDPELIVFGSTGGTDYEKGWLELVYAIAGLPDALKTRCRIIVAGDPPAEDIIQTIASLQMQSQVMFPGLLDDIRPVLAASDVGFVLSHNEALSFAARESMACGLPTIVSDAGGLPENLEHGVSGWITPAKNVPALRALLEEILPDAALRGAIAQHSRQRAEAQFNLSVFAERTLQVYKSVR